MNQAPVVKKTVKWMFRVYIAWSVCADIVLITGVLMLLLGDLQISF